MASEQKHGYYTCMKQSALSVDVMETKEEVLKSTTYLEDVLTLPSTARAYVGTVTNLSVTTKKNTSLFFWKRLCSLKEWTTTQLKKTGGSCKKILKSLLEIIKV